TISYKSKERELFESFSGLDMDFRTSKKKMYYQFLRNTKLPFPENYPKEKIEIFLRDFEKFSSIDDVQFENMNLESPSSGLRWDSSHWTFDGFCINERRPSNLAYTVLNVTEFLEKKSSKDKFICEKWLNENNFEYKLDDDQANEEDIQSDQKEEEKEDH
ncbi:unnamed protein product, partial [Brachionus calyciflorus]